VTGWRAYALGAYVGIVSWTVLTTVAEYARHREGTLLDYASNALVTACIAIPLCFVLGLLTAELA
jgi:hypothetical protein